MAEKRRPLYGFDIVLLRRDNSIGLGTVHMGVPFNFRTAIAEARSANVEAYGESSLEVALIDQLMNDLNASVPIESGLPASNDQQKAERLILILRAIGPMLSQAIIHSDDHTSRTLSDLVDGLTRQNRAALRSMEVEAHSG